MNQPTLKPTDKMMATGVSGAAATITLFVLGQLGIHLPGEVAAAFVVLLAFAAGYIKRESV